MRASHRKGAAMTEFALLAPVYVLLLIGLVYFSNVVLMWQEIQLASRFLSMNTRSEAAGGGQATLIATTSGATIPEDYFIYMSTAGAPEISVSTVPGEFTQQQIRDELIKASWTVTQSFTPQPDGGTASAQVQTMTADGQVVYGLKYDPEAPPAYAFDGDDTLIADELSRWFNRKTASVTLVFDSNFVRVGRWKLPPAKASARAEAVVREAGCDERSLTESQEGYRKPIEDLLADFGDGPVPLPDYPGFGGSDGFWEPN